MATGAAEDTEVEVLVVAVVVAVVMVMVSEEDVVGLSIVITHLNSPPGTEYLWQMPVYTRQKNGGSSPCNKIIIFKK